MAIQRSQVRQEILDQTCDRCGSPCPEDDTNLSFRNGQFVVFHEKCIRMEFQEREDAIKAAFGNHVFDGT